ncbi:MAG: histidine phosphatase family protein [Actinobacteria bacterium]|nr:MAG: histidine phosphatase family protein [Actinomycetota bacterium]
MKIVLRHARAGERSEWEGDDRLRPLDEKGRRLALRLVGELAPLGVTRIVSSPYVRCTQTVEPLAAELGLPVETDDRLAEGASRDAVDALLRETPPGSVLCTHGDIVELILGKPLKKGAFAVLDD